MGGQILGEVYNPDPNNEIARRMLEEFESRRAFPLRDVRRRSFGHGGVYALYYNGPFALYQSIRSPDSRIPIYIGKADGDVGTRLKSHFKSINNAYNLDLDHFTVRVLPLTAAWAVWTEALFHEHYDPLWIRGAFTGFGNNNPGSKRSDGKASNWDVIHPGREWALTMSRSSNARVQLKAEQERWELENANLVVELFGGKAQVEDDSDDPDEILDLFALFSTDR